MLTCFFHFGASFVVFGCGCIFLKGVGTPYFRGVDVVVVVNVEFEEGVGFVYGLSLTLDSGFFLES